VLLKTFFSKISIKIIKKINMLSPLSGKEMKLMSETSTLTYKGIVYEVIHHYYLCELTNEKFTTTELDEKNLEELYKQCY
jgi:hypothetical protein